MQTDLRCRCTGRSTSLRRAGPGPGAVSNTWPRSAPGRVSWAIRHINRPRLVQWSKSGRDLPGTDRHAVRRRRCRCRYSCRHRWRGGARAGPRGVWADSRRARAESQRTGTGWSGAKVVLGAARAGSPVAGVVRLGPPGLPGRPGRPGRRAPSRRGLRAPGRPGRRAPGPGPGSPPPVPPGPRPPTGPCVPPGPSPSAARFRVRPRRQRPYGGPGRPPHRRRYAGSPTPGSRGWAAGCSAVP